MDYLVKGKDFKKLINRAKELGAKYLDYSSRKNKKYVVTLPGSKKIHFASNKYSDYLIHKDKNRRERYLKRSKGIKNKKGDLTYKNRESPNYWSVNLLW